MRGSRIAFPTVAVGPSLDIRLWSSGWSGESITTKPGEAGDDESGSSSTLAAVENAARFSADRSNALYRERAHDDFFPAERRAIETYFVHAGSRVLDLGCGTGRATRLLERMGYDVIGADLSEVLVAAGAEVSPGLEFVAADAADLPFADESLRYVLFS